MSYYKLQVHIRDLAINVVGGVARHTGYDLVEYDDNGNAISIKTIDVLVENGQTDFYIETGTGENIIRPITYIVDTEGDVRVKTEGETLNAGETEYVWPETIHFGDISNYKIGVNDIENKHFSTLTLSVYDPETLFDRIVFDATFRKSLYDSGIDGGGIDYSGAGPNCHSWVNYIDETYLGIGVFRQFESTGIINDYVGWNTKYEQCSDPKDARNAAILEQISTKFFANDVYSKDFNFDNFTIQLINAREETATGNICGFAARISDGTHNYLFDFDDANGVGHYIEDTEGESSHIIVGNGINTTIVAGNGNDILDFRGITNGESVNQAFGGSGDDTYIFKKGYEGTTIIDDESGTTDKIIFDGLTQFDGSLPSELKFVANGANLEIYTRKEDGTKEDVASVIIKNFFRTSANVTNSGFIEEFQFAGGVVVNKDQGKITYAEYYGNKFFGTDFNEYVLLNGTTEVYSNFSQAV
ncbi:MAG: hypothetical protein ACK5N8_03335 [Alphaproteobacteria bacterium]